MFKRKKKIGEILLEEKIITQEELNKVFEYRKGKNIKTGKSLIELGYITESDLLDILSRQLNVPVKKIGDVKIDRDVKDMVTEEFVKTHKFIPFEKTDSTLKLLVNDPLNLVLEDEIFLRTGLKAEFYLLNEHDLSKLIEKIYDSNKVLQDLGLIEDDSIDYSTYDIGNTENSAPVIKIINSIFRDAVRLGASDIHISVNEDDLDIRLRVDGILQEIDRLPKNTSAPIIARIKMMADLDITEKRVPQDGSITIEIEGKPIDLRVSTLPSIFGEKLVIRLLEKNESIMNIDNIGFSENNLTVFKELISLPIGIFLVTGPTGSGKSSTLYAAINELNTVDVNIVTIEDPVEFKLKGITQVQVSTKVGLGFSEGLRSILRQDPDIVLVGEIRDHVTAEIAVRASNTGHLVFSTLHTNSAVSTVVRLVDMGIESYLVASTVVGVLNQRLVRKICSKCKVSYTTGGGDKDRIFFNVNSETELTLYKGEGCEYCNFTGYKGRMPIHELLVVNDSIRRMIVEGKMIKDIEKVAIENGMRTLKMDGFEKALKGITTLEEVRRFVVE
jgi:type IV pilus assembly protein PilB